MKELNKIQTGLNAPKNQNNTFGGYKYRSLEDICEAAKPLLKETGCTLTFTDDLVLIGDRYYVKSTATIRNASGECEQATAFAREQESKKGMDEAQVTGSASSYARKYAACSLLCIDDNREPDMCDNREEGKAKPRTRKAPAMETKAAPARPQIVKGMVLTSEMLKAGYLDGIVAKLAAFKNSPDFGKNANLIHDYYQWEADDVFNAIVRRAKA